MTVASFRFSLPLEGKLWQTAFDQVTGQLWLELRDEEQQQVVYRSLDLAAGALSEALQIPTVDWWTSISRVYANYLLLEQYTDPQNPTEKSLIVYHAMDQTVSQHIADFQFTHHVGNEFFGESLKNQQQTKSFTLEVDQVPEQYELSEPVYYAPDSESHQLVFEFLGMDAVPLGCEYFERGDHIIIGYYQRSGTKFDRLLMVLHKGEALFHEKIDEGMNGFASGSFFVFDQLMVYVKNGKEINGIEL